MHVDWKAIVLVPALIAAGFAGGCGKGDGTQPGPAAINGEDGEKSGSDAAGQAGGEKPARDNNHPVVVFDTSMGSITVRLDGEKAPQTVESFLSYMNKGHYHDTIFHQVFKGQGVLGGGYTIDLVKKPTRTPIFNEAHNGLKNRRGTIAMVRLADSVNSATSQFFFNLADNEALDYKDRTPEGYGYCVFGQVTAGLEVLDKIGSVPVEDTPQFDRKPVQVVVLKSVRQVK
jgi:cyclophilin family peptidyl-prolyl cis-trans isomerase